MSQVTTAGRLLGELERESSALRQSVVRAAGIATEKVEQVMTGASRLSLSEQLRLAEAALLLAPSLARSATRLREQALAARSYETGDVERRIEAPAQRWERASGLR